MNAFMTSGSTGYDTKVWETMTHWYDVQGWIPKNIVIINKAAFEALPTDQKAAIIVAAETAEVRGWKIAEEKAAWYVEQLVAKGIKVLPPSDALKTGLQKIGEQLSADWQKRAGPVGDEVITSYRK